MNTARIMMRGLVRIGITFAGLYIPYKLITWNPWVMLTPPLLMLAWFVGQEE